MRPILYTLLLLLAAGCPQSAAAAPDFYSEGRKYVHPSLVFDRTAVQPDELEHTPDVRAGVLLKIEPGWHVYWRNSGDAGLPTKISWNLPPGFKAGNVKWPIPFKIEERGGIVTFGYTNEVLLSVELYAPIVEPDGEQQFDFAAEVTWLVCSDVCIPGRQLIHGSLRSSLSAPAEPSPAFSLFTSYELMLPEDRPPALVDVVRASRGETVGVKIGVQHLLGRMPAASPDLRGALQVFPYENEEVTLGEASLSGCSPDDCFIRAPARIAADASPGKKKLEGLLAAAPSISTQQRTVALPWSIEVEVQNMTAPAQAPETAPAPEQRLLYLVHLGGASPAGADETRAGRGSAAAALLFGLLGGMLLNLMPCVLPIIAIKVMGFVQAGDRSRSSSMAAAGAFGAGVLFSFLALAGVVLTLRASGYDLGWGFQFQHPAYVFVLMLVVYVLSLGFFDVYRLSVPGSRQADKALTRLRPGILHNFLDGILTTALSTPCTAPFLGTALVIAFAQPPALAVLIFLSIGLGLALPYMILTASPSLSRRLPRPGAWMTRLRQILGFVLLATVLWLLFVLQHLKPEGALWGVAAMLLIYFGFWLNSWLQEGLSGRFGRTATALLLIASGALIVNIYGKIGAAAGPSAAAQPRAAKISWQRFSPALLQQLRLSGKPAFLVFTADWCLTCKANEFLVIETSAIAKALEQYGIVPVRADWTTGDDDVTRALKQYGAEGVPLYVLIAPSGEPVVLPALLTRDTLLRAMSSISKNAE